MTKIGHYARRAKELGPTEVVQRASHRLMDRASLEYEAIRSEWKAGHPLTDAALLAQTTGSWRSVQELLVHLANRRGTSYLLPFDAGDEAAAKALARFPEFAASIVAAADGAFRGEVKLLGHSVSYPNGIEWNKDPLTGYGWPLDPVARVRPLAWSVNRPADLILTWELNRHQHFVTLGIAYWLTNDPRFSEVFGSQLRSWIQANPPEHGIHWLHGIEIAIRLIAWTAAFQCFRHSELFLAQCGGAFLKSLYQQADFLSHHLQTNWQVIPNNHLMAEATGLAVVGAVFPEFRLAQNWRETALRLLTEQIEKQTHADGVNREQAMGYHRFISELVMLVVALARRGVLPRVMALEDALERMLDYAMFSLTPSHTVPMWGDTDQGRALGMGPEADFWDLRPLLAKGAALFGRADYKFAAGRFDAEAYWLLGAEGLATWESLSPRPPAETSRAFPAGGIYILRDNWTAESDVLFFRCGPFGLGGEDHCAHAHCDLLSLQVWLAGRPLLVDAGTYTYSGPWRDHFRLTASHNTVMVDGLEQALPYRDFVWRKVPQAECVFWNGKRVVGKLRTASGVQVIREIGHPCHGQLEINDTFEAEGIHSIDWFLHFAPGLTIDRSGADGQLRVEGQDGTSVSLLPPAGASVEIKSGWYSSAYLIKEPNPVLVARWNGDIPREGISFAWKFHNADRMGSG